MTSIDPTSGSTPTLEPTTRIHKALLGTGGDVIRYDKITEAEAIIERRAGRDVVVCGDSLVDNHR